MAWDVVAMEVAVTEVVVMKHVQLEFALLTDDLWLWGSSGLSPLPPKWEMDQSPSVPPSGFHESTEGSPWCLVSMLSRVGTFRPSSNPTLYHLVLYNCIELSLYVCPVTPV